MDEHEELRAQLKAYICKKFYTRRNILDMADEIVNQAFLDILKLSDLSLINFGYLSAACLRRAYKVFHYRDREDGRTTPLDNNTPLISEDNFVSEVEQTEDTAYVLVSLQTLKDVERIIVSERYYGCFTFREISERHGIKLNTVLSHHRRALAKLKPVLADYFIKENGNG
jgi:RNA polymerase sigma factor (sigma-70 family)